MARNLDLAALRSLVAVADSKGVTRAAEQVNLTQSAVSMQIKRLEEQFGTKLLLRNGRGIALSGTGEQLVSYARRLVTLNDETWTRLTTAELEGELRLGVPYDIVYPQVPYILRQARQLYPRVKVTLVSEMTKHLKTALEHGSVDLILTTEQEREPGGETLTQLPHVWVGRRQGTAYLRRPLPLAMCRSCAMRPEAIGALDKAGIAWELAGDTDSDVTVAAIVAADLGVSSMLGGTMMGPDQVPIENGALPELPDALINLYRAPAREAGLVDKIADLVRQAYSMDPSELARPR